MTEREVFVAACGVDEEGVNRSLVKIETKFLTMDGEEDAVGEITLDGPVVNIFRSMRFTMLDLTYDSGTDFDFVHAVQLLKDFSVPENSLDDEDTRVPCIQLTVMPKELDGVYYITGVHGTWCLMPSVPGRADDTIRFLFENDLVHTYRINETEIDAGAVQEEVFRQTMTARA